MYDSPSGFFLCSFIIAKLYEHKNTEKSKSVSLTSFAYKIYL